MKRVLIGALVGLAFVVPTAARADTQTWTPSASTPYHEYHDTRSDSSGVNQMIDDPTTGDMAVVRAAAGSLGGSLGCGGDAPFAYFYVDHVVGDSVSKVTVNLSNVVMDGFTWIKVITSIVGGDGELKTTEFRGPTASPSLTLTVDDPANAVGETPKRGDTLRIAFGMETVSACPNVDGGRATFGSVSVS